jgi:hypothetical protein
MTSRISRAPRHAVAFAVAVLAVPLLSASIVRASAGEATPASEYHPSEWPLVSLELTADRDALDDVVVSAPLTLAADDAEEKPVEVPLPPALATGLAGLGAMAVLRVGHRVYRRR